MKNIINKFLIIGAIICVTHEGCKSQDKPIKNDGGIEDAKWYYYAYTNNLEAYSNNTGITSLSPLSCDVKLDTTIHINKDTVEIYFSIYYQNKENKCTLKPLGLAGVVVIKNYLFAPIYNMIIPDPKDEKIIVGMMKSQSDLLRKNIQLKHDQVVPWLVMEVERRKGL